MRSRGSVSRFALISDHRACLWWLLGLVLFLVGCGRKAPGPDECHDLAVRWVASPAIVARGRVVRLRVDGDEVLRRTTICLTTPYDRTLVACVQAARNIEGCYAAFESRRRAGAPAVE